MAIFLIVLLLLGLALELWSLYDGLKHVEADFAPARDRVEPGTPFRLDYWAANRGRLPISYLRLELGVPISAEVPGGEEAEEERFTKFIPSVFRLWGRQRRQRSLELILRNRGVHIFDALRLTRGDFLGLSQVKEEKYLRREVLVYPRPVENDALNMALGSYCGDVIAARYLIQDPILTAGIREYTGREPMKTITWSQSARRGALYVREFDYTREESCGVLLCTNGLGPLENELLDLCCSIARTVTETLTEKGVQVALHTNAPLWGYIGNRVWSCSAGPGRMTDALDTLARVYAASRCPAVELAGTVSRAAGGNAYILIAPRHVPEIDEALEALRGLSGAQVIPVYAQEWMEEKAE